MAPQRRRARRAALYAAPLVLATLAVACSGAGVADEPPTAAPQAGPEAAGTARPAPDPPDPREEERHRRLILFAFPEIEIDRHTVPLAEIVSGGVAPDDGIPSIQEPAFVSIAEAAEWLDGREPVITLEVGGEAKIYPIQVLIWHEIVNDVLGGRPVLVTFCPLCNTAIAFDRRVGGDGDDVRRFGVSGLLRESDLVMFDYETTTLWQQFSGEGIVGAGAGRRLDLLPAHIVSFADARTTYPDAPVLSRETGFRRDYGRNPYSGYDRVGVDTYFETSFDDERLPAKARVLTVEINGDAVAFPFNALAQWTVIHESVGGEPVVAFYQGGATTPLDGPDIAQARDVGAAAAFIARVGGEAVRFEARDGAIHDVATGSRWNVLGHAVDGPLAGTRLEPVLSGNHFWFSWSVFKPETRIVS